MPGCHKCIYAFPWKDAPNKNNDQVVMFHFEALPQFATLIRCRRRPEALQVDTVGNGLDGDLRYSDLAEFLRHDAAAGNDTIEGFEDPAPVEVAEAPTKRRSMILA